MTLHRNTILRVLTVLCLETGLFIPSMRFVRASSDVLLRAPFIGEYRITAWVDHDYPSYLNDDVMIHYTDENHANCNPPTYFSYCYDGHSGTDFATPLRTPIYAAASGTVEISQDGTVGYGKRVVIRHSNNYRTLYAHLDERIVQINDFVSEGQLIGYSGETGSYGAPHLHFGVYRGPFTTSEQYVTDPFGWQGSGNDPLAGFYSSGVNAECLWRSYPDDFLSCADIVLEDGQNGSSFLGLWNQNVIGNSWQMHYHINDNASGNTTFAVWGDPKISGKCEISVWIPSLYATSHYVQYWITDSQSFGWLGGTVVNQSNFSDKWVYIDT